MKRFIIAFHVSNASQRFPEDRRSGTAQTLDHDMFQGSYLWALFILSEPTFGAAGRRRIIPVIKKIII